MRAYSATGFGALSCAAMAIIASCSGGGAAPASTGAPNASDDAGGAIASGSDTNPEGVRYPSPPGGYGHTARRGTSPGGVIENFKFLGYPNADASHGLQTIALADYYDPCSKRYKLIHLNVGALWCVPCNDETDAMVAARQQLASQNVVVVQALSDGQTPGSFAKQSDLDYWISKHRATFTEMLDPGLQNLGVLFSAASVPWNCDIDPRTMEIVDARTGWSGDLTLDIAAAMAAIPSTPSFAIPVQCP